MTGFTNEACDGQDAIVAGNSNGIGDSGNAYNSLIGAGNTNVIRGDDALIGAGEENYAYDSAFVGAGDYNAASGQGSAVVGGGYEYLIAQGVPKNYGNQASGIDAFVGGGDVNVAQGNGSAIAAGGYSQAELGATSGSFIGGMDSFIGAGDENTIAANEAFVGGGQSNSIASKATYAVIAGGSTNAISSLSGAIGGGAGNMVTGQYGTVSGGDGNVASGNAATVAGGYKNLASGQFSFAAGFGSYADKNGSFVWSDDSPSSGHLAPTAANEFIARATGGVVFLTNAAETTGVKLAAGGGAWASASDRNLKRDVANINDAEVLAKVAALPVAEWSYASERGVRHVGPMAQDFYAAFKVGEDDRHITSIDEDGVALAAIKALHHENAGLHAENAALRERLVRDEARRTRDEARHVRELAALEGQIRALAENAHLAIYRKAGR